MGAGADQLETDVATVVAAHALVPIEQVRPSTRIWHDLKLAGDDFADLIEELHRTYGLTLRGHLGDYCPTEGNLMWAFWWWPFRRKKSYRELTVADLAAGARSNVHVG
jgi:hypothetical protein